MVCMYECVCIYFLAPEALFVIPDTKHFGANESVLFELVQLAVSHC